MATPHCRNPSGQSPTAIRAGRWRKLLLWLFAQLFVATLSRAGD